MKKEWTWISSLAIILILLLAACSSPAPTSAPPKTSAPAPAPAATTTAAPKPTTAAPTTTAAPKPATTTPAPAATTTAAAWKPPAAVGVAFPSTTGSGYISGVALLTTIQDVTGVKFPTTPSAKTMGRAQLLKQGTVSFTWAPSLDSYFMLEGRDEFQDAGPQSVRSCYIGGPLDVSMVARADAGIKTMADLKGKKVSSLPTYPTSQLYLDGALAYAQMTWKDVIAVPQGSTAEARKALVEGAIDSTFMSGETAETQQLAASSHGIQWIPFPNKTDADKAAWARLNALNPTFFPLTSTTSPGQSADKPAYSWGWNYYVMCYDFTDANLVYWMAKQIVENYDKYSPKHSYLKRWTLAEALDVSHWFTPWHDGAIKYFKEIGKWTPAMDAKQKEMLTKYPKTMTK